MKKRAASLFMALVMVLSLVPAGVLASQTVAAPAATETAAEALGAGSVSNATDAAALMGNPGGPCGENAVWTLEDGVLTISGTGATEDYWEYTPWYEGNAYLTVTSVVVEDGITSIGVGTFANCPNLSSATLPASVTNLSYAAFLGTALRSITIPGEKVTIGAEAFYDCVDLEEVIVTGSVSSIGASAFSIEEEFISVGMSLTRAVFPGQNIAIGDMAFTYCENLENISFPGSIASIGMGAFYGCTALAEFYYGGTEADWQSVEIGDYNADVLSGTHFTFGRSSGSPTITAASLRDGSGEATSLVDATVSLPESIRVAYVFCVAYQNGKMTGLDYKNAQKQDTGATWTKTLNFSVTAVQYDSVKVFLMDSDLKPLAKPYTL